MESPIYWSHQDGISKLASYAIQRNLIPFIGAGFSAGSEAAGGCVPDGAIACQELIQLILESDLTLSQNDILGLSFTNLAELFFDSVPSDKRAAYFEKNFTDVELPSSRRDFINKINWPYLYTINFDDGIERCSKYKAILPYKNFVHQKHPRNFCISFTEMLHLKRSILILQMKKILFLVTANI